MFNKSVEADSGYINNLLDVVKKDFTARFAGASCRPAVISFSFVCVCVVLWKQQRVCNRKRLLCCLSLPVGLFSDQLEAGALTGYDYTAVFGKAYQKAKGAVLPKGQSPPAVSADPDP